MTRTIRVSAIALAISAGWTLPAQARATSDAVAQELAAMRAQMEAMAQRIDTLEAQLTEARTRADAAQAAVTAQASALPQQIAAAIPPAPAVARSSCSSRATSKGSRRLWRPSPAAAS